MSTNILSPRERAASAGADVGSLTGSIEEAASLVDIAAARLSSESFKKTRETKEEQGQGAIKEDCCADLNAVFDGMLITIPDPADPALQIATDDSSIPSSATPDIEMELGEFDKVSPS